MFPQLTGAQQSRIVDEINCFAESRSISKRPVSNLAVSPVGRGSV
jgi:hypothetical protein